MRTVRLMVAVCVLTVLSAVFFMGNETMQGILIFVGLLSLNAILLARVYSGK